MAACQVGCRCGHRGLAHSLLTRQCEECDCEGWEPFDDRFIDLAGLGPVEREMLTMMESRLRNGQSLFGKWDVHDGREYEAEAIQEVIDCCHYMLARLLKLKRK